MNMINISRNTYERIDIETTVDNDGIVWLNETHIEEELGLKNLQEIKAKHHSNHRKHRYELTKLTKETTHQNFYAQRISSQRIHGL